MIQASLVDELIADRRFEEHRENIEDAFNAMSSNARFRRVAAHAYVSLVGIWKLNSSDAARFLSISETNYSDWEDGHYSRLTAIELEKISCLLGIYKYLMILYSGNSERASGWWSRSNHGALFGGQTPHNFLTGGRTEVFCSVRRELAAATAE